ncbi:NepR family anti-sigma factor [Paracoccus seriniphilus]|nr:NepR family anti-sigma factor [Paracoccus seriniphilus]
MVASRAHRKFGINKNMMTKRDDGRREAVEKQIDENLRRVYEQDATEQIPDRFLELLKKLREQE